MQDRCAMKVCTDSCIFGAYINPKDANNILDIGSGSGLLALMVAQRSSSNITAIEIDEQAAQQARENFESSPWNDRLTIFCDDVLNFSQQNLKFDLIISNPPFYTNHLKSPDQAINNAMHCDSLTLKNLACVVDRLLSGLGTFEVMLPEYEMKLLTQFLQEFKFLESNRLVIKNDERSNPLRIISSFSRNSKICIQNQLCIRNEIADYTTDFKDLLKHYYLHL